MPSLTAAVAQFAPTGDKTANLSTIESLLREAKELGARLVVLPEYAVFTVPAMDESFIESAEPLDGPSVTRIAQLSVELNMGIVAGVNETAEGGRIHNTLVGMQNGRIEAIYRKVHLYDAFGYRESDRVIGATPQKPALLEVDGFKVGMQTCYDLRFPEAARVLVDSGADIIALPAEWMPGPLKEFHWNTLIRARAIENTVYLLAADQCPPTGVGHSAIVDPMGIAMATVGESEGLGVAVVERGRLDNVRRVNPALALRRFAVVPESHAGRV